VDVTTDPPPELIPIPLKGAVLLLTQAEFTAGVRRGKWWRRRVAMEQRCLQKHHERRGEAPTLVRELRRASRVGPRSRGRRLAPQPSGSLLDHGGEPLGRFGPFGAEARGLDLEPPDLLAQRLTLLLEPLAVLLGRLCHHLELAALAQKLAHPLEDRRGVFHPPKHPLPLGSRHLTGHGSLSLVTGGLQPIRGGAASG
jgi:hypothetical protein